MSAWYEKDPVPEVEAFMEERYEQISGGGDLKFIKVAALISLAFGVSNASELTLASAGMLAQYFADSDGIDGIISMLSGIQLATLPYSNLINYSRT